MARNNNNNNKSKNSVGLADVARVAGVSTATVSLALQEGSRITSSTRERVLEAVNLTGYRYNRLAAKLRTGKTMTIGLMITDIANPYFAALAAAVEIEMDRFGYMTFLVNSADSNQRQHRQLESLREHGVDGILLSPADGTASTTVNEIIESGVPVIQVSRWIPDAVSDVVTTDNVSSAAEATQHLLSLGHRRIAFIGGTETRSARVERICGYTRELAAAGIALDPCLTPTATPTRADGARLLTGLLALPDPPTAVLCYHDLMALGALEAAGRMGLVVGRDLAIIGFDDITEAALSSPPLTTVHVDIDRIGRCAAARLLARMSGDTGPSQHIIIPARMVIRQSCGAFQGKN